MACFGKKNVLLKYALNIKFPGSISSRTVYRDWERLPGTPEEEVERLRDVSRMSKYLKQRMEAHKTVPDLTLFPYQKTQKFRRRLFARYGKQSGVDPGICWPTREELQEKLEYEKEWIPTLQQMLENVQANKEEKANYLEQRKRDILYNMSQMDKWVKEVEEVRIKKIEQENAQRLKKEQLIEEISQHFGYRVDPAEEKFQEMLALKEREEKKLEKEARKKAKMARELEQYNKMSEKAQKENKSENTETEVKKESGQEGENVKDQNDKPQS